MSEQVCTFPIIALQRFWNVKNDAIFLEVYEDEEDFSRWSPEQMAVPDRKAFEVFDSAGRRFVIASFERVTPIQRWWDMSTWFGRGAWVVRVQFRALESISLEAAKGRMIEVVDSDPTMWCDEGLVVGAAGEPIEEDVLIARVHDRIRGAETLSLIHI